MVKAEQARQTPRNQNNYPAEDSCTVIESVSCVELCQEQTAADCGVRRPRRCHSSSNCLNEMHVDDVLAWNVYVNTAAACAAGTLETWGL